MKRHSEEAGIFTRTRKRLKDLEYKGKATIKDLPTEVVWKIFEYLDDDSFLNIRNVCKSVSKAQTVMFYHLCNTVPHKILSSRRTLFNSLYSHSFDNESKRLDITKSLLYLEWLKTEFTILVGILWRYDVNAESVLFDKLWVVVKEMLDRIESSMKVVPFSDVLADIRVLNPASSLPTWAQFIDNFDEILEPTLGISIPFETRVVDILASCPSSNLQIIFNGSLSGDAVGFKAFFQIQDSCSERQKPVFLAESDSDYEKAILKFLRFTVRTRNSLMMANLFDEIKNLEFRLCSNFLNESNRNRILLLLEERYSDLTSSFYEPLNAFKDRKNRKCFFRRSSFDVSNNYLECFLEKNRLKAFDVPLMVICPHIFQVEKTDGFQDYFLRCDDTTNKRSNEDDLIKIPVKKPFQMTVVFKRWLEGVKFNITRDGPIDGRHISFTVIEY